MKKHPDSFSAYVLICCVCGTIKRMKYMLTEGCFFVLAPECYVGTLQGITDNRWCRFW